MFTSYPQVSTVQQFCLHLHALTLSLQDRPKPSTLLFYSVLHQTILLVKGEPLGGKGLNILNWSSYCTVNILPGSTSNLWSQSMTFFFWNKRNARRSLQTFVLSSSSADNLPLYSANNTQALSTTFASRSALCRSKKKHKRADWKNLNFHEHSLGMKNSFFHN